jgi:hypothetical protein
LNKQSQDLCALTKKSGKFVKSHIIPVALTRLSKTGEKYVETGIGHDFKRRPTSWYDNALVTRDGEDILADIDTRAIEILRMNKLIWSSWGTETRLESDDIVLRDSGAKHRLLAFDQPGAIQIFYLSLLWRAAASNRPELSDTSVDPAILEDIRARVVARDPGDFSDYPIQIFQISTLGTPHNRTPLRESKEIPDSTSLPKETIDYLRIYFDGLIAHVHLRNGHSLSEIYLNSCLQEAGQTLVFLHTFEESRALANIKEMQATVSSERDLARQIAATLSKRDKK